MFHVDVVYVVGATEVVCGDDNALDRANGTLSSNAVNKPISAIFAFFLQIVQRNNSVK